MKLYEIKFNPVMTSIPRQTLVLGALWLMLSLMFAGCSKSSDAEGKVTPNDARPPVAVDAAMATAGNMTQGVEVTGSLKPKFEVDVKSEITGLVKKVYVTQWVPVKRGAPLAQIDIRELEAVAKKASAARESARASQLQAAVLENRARRELQRMIKLKEAGLATQQSLDDARSEVDAAAARVRAASAQECAADEDLNQIRTRLTKGFLTAPMDGIVSERRIHVGDLVGEAGSNIALFHIVDNRILDLTVTVPSASMAGLRRGQTLQFTTDAAPGRTFAGKITFINPSVNETDRSVKVVAEVDNVFHELKGGLFVKGRILTGIRLDVIRVPRTALSGWDVAGRKARLIVVEGDRARFREITTGLVSQDGVEIKEGLKPGETYIVRGGFNVREGDRLTIATLKERIMP